MIKKTIFRTPSTNESLWSAHVASVAQQRTRHFMTHKAISIMSGTESVDTIMSFSWLWNKKAARYHNGGFQSFLFQTTAVLTQIKRFQRIQKIQKNVEESKTHFLVNSQLSLVTSNFRYTYLSKFWWFFI